jgi:hypothetical protein
MPGGDYFENLGVERKIVCKGGLKLIRCECRGGFIQVTLDIGQ